MSSRHLERMITVRKTKIRGPTRQLPSFMQNLLGMLVLVLLWWAGSRFTSDVFLPGPEDVVDSLIGLCKTNQLQMGFMYTMLRIFLATAISIGVSLPLSLAIYSSRTLSNLFMPVISMFRFVPVTAFSPMLILWVGIGEGFKIAFIFCATFVYVLPSMLMSLREVSDQMIEAGQALGMKKWQITKYIVLPIAAPSISESCLMMLGIGFTYVAVTEAVNARYGLGYIINQASSRGKMSICFAAILVIMIVSYLFDNIGKKLITKAFRWKYLSE